MSPRTYAVVACILAIAVFVLPLALAAMLPLAGVWGGGGKHP